MIKQTVAEWKCEAEERFGKSPKNWKFQCPVCGHVQTPLDFVEFSDDPANDAYTQCIGRVNGKGTKNQTDKGHGCNWAAYGLFGTAGKGRIIIADSGKEVEIFDFANDGDKGEEADEKSL